MKKILTLSLMSAASLMAMDDLENVLKKSAACRSQTVSLPSEQTINQKQLAQSSIAKTPLQNPQSGSSAYSRGLEPSTREGCGSNAQKTPQNIFATQAKRSFISELDNLNEDNAHLMMSRVAPYGGMNPTPELGGYLAYSNVGGGALNLQKLETIKQMVFGEHRFEDIIQTQEEALKKNEAKRNALNAKAEALDVRAEKEFAALEKLENALKECVNLEDYEQASALKTQKQNLMARYQNTRKEAESINAEIETCSQNIECINSDLKELYEKFEIQKNFRLESERYRAAEDLVRSEKGLEKNLARDFFTLMARVRSIDFDKIESVPDYIKAVNDTIVDMKTLNVHTEFLADFQNVDRRSTTTEALEAMKKNFKDQVIMDMQCFALAELKRNQYNVYATFVVLLKKFDCTQVRSVHIMQNIDFKTKQDDVDKFLTLKESADASQYPQRELGFVKKGKEFSDS
jgi:hypothetical protein